MTVIPFSYLRKFERSQYYLITSGYSNFSNCQKISYGVFFTRCSQDSCVVFSYISLSISFNLERASSTCVNLGLSILSMIRFRIFFSFSQCCILIASHQEVYDIRVLLSMNAKFDCWLRSQPPDLPISVLFPTVISLWSNSLRRSKLCVHYTFHYIHWWSLPELQHWGLQNGDFLIMPFFVYWLVFFVIE